MAAGMGSRYGGLKQIDPVDKEGHIIMDFSMYDAKRAGFEKVKYGSLFLNLQLIDYQQCANHLSVLLQNAVFRMSINGILHDKRAHITISNAVY